jgi:GNAT superfamily N-acetyltransferase
MELRRGPAPLDFATRDLAHSDLHALLALYRHLHAGDDPVPDTIGSIWDRILRDPSQIYLGAFVGDLLVSTCNASVVPNLTRGGRPYAIIENVVTDAAYRRRGIGSSLMRELLARCWARRCYKVMLLSATMRSDAHDFYVGLGFDNTAKQAFVAKPTTE